MLSRLERTGRLAPAKLPHPVGQALDGLAPQIRRECLRSLYKICGRQALLPRSLGIPLCYDPTETPLRRGGFADVWRGRHHGQEVAAKALRVRSTDDFERIRKVGCPRFVCVNEPTASCIGVLQGGHGMGGTPPSERAATARRNDFRKPASDGIGMDGEREYQRVYEGGSQRGSARTCMFPVQALHFYS